jgi:translocation and assembly module TamB
MQGAITGKMVLEGKTTDPRFNGKFHMQSFDFTVIKTNTRLNSTGGINISNNLISFTDFTIKDSLQNKLDIKGQIDFSKFSDPLFAMEVSTNDFLLINKKIEQKDVIEGKLNLGLQLRVDGRKSKLKVRNDITINESTNVAYMMPGNDLELITDEGIVKYIDFDQAEPDTVLVQKQKFIGDSIVSLVKGIDLRQHLASTKRQNLRLLLIQSLAIFQSSRLTGRLQYLYNDKQKGKLNGLVEFTEGFYELSFYGPGEKTLYF